MLTLITMAVLAIGVPLGLAMSLVIHDLHDLLLYGSILTLAVAAGGIIGWRWVVARKGREPGAEAAWLHEAPSTAEPATAWAALHGEAAPGARAPDAEG